MLFAKKKKKKKTFDSHKYVKHKIHSFDTINIYDLYLLAAINKYKLLAAYYFSFLILSF